jgi:hypothetical protein
LARGECHSGLALSDADRVQTGCAER